MILSWKKWKKEKKKEKKEREREDNKKQNVVFLVDLGEKNKKRLETSCLEINIVNPLRLG